MSITVKLESFEGPLDLLLHLIDKNKVNIYDIPIAMITDQYMEYLDAFAQKDLDTMSEFLVMAATLLNIKARMLLPVETEEAEEDPRQDLVERLLEYKMYKYISGELKTKQYEASFALYKDPSLPPEVTEKKEEIDPEEVIMNSNVDVQRLFETFQDVMRRKKDRIDPIRSGFGKIEKEEIDVPAKISYVTTYCKSHHRMRFRELLEQQESRTELVVTFLCVLEMMKTGMVTVEQDSLFDDILINYKGDGNGTEEFGSYR